MKIADLRERVAIKSETRTVDGRGGYTSAYTTTVDTVWAAVAAESADERTAGMQVEHARRYRVVIRYRADVSSTNRLTWGSKTLKVLGFHDKTNERKRFLVINCEECPA